MSKHQAWALALLVGAGACGGPIAPPAEADAELIVFGAGPGGVADACFTCHGLEGQGQGDAPRLAGLESGYLVKQMSDYALGVRASPVMEPIARRLHDNARQAVSHYYAALDYREPALGPAPALYALGDARRGVRACAECHGDAAEGDGAANPALAGQPRAYTADQLYRWKHGLRRNDARDVMGAVARPLTDAEIEALAAYLAGPSP